MLTQPEIDFFHANGYVIMRGLLRGEELKTLQRAADVVQAQGVERKDSKDAKHRYVPMPDGSQVYWRSEEVWERADIFRAVTVNPDVLENVGQCIGQAFYPWNDSLVVKLPHNGAPVAWHQDPPYWVAERLTTFAIPNFTTDLYLDHSGPDNGCVYAIPGHHLVGHVDLAGKTHEQLIEYGAIPLEMEAGDVLFHCLSTPHGSMPNPSSRQRRIFYLHYIADEAYLDGYAKEPWAKLKPGWGDVRKRMTEEMIATRAKLKMESPTDRKTLRFGDGGFEFGGAPTTPQRHWAALSASIPQERRAAMKNLRKDVGERSAQLSSLHRV